MQRHWYLLTCLPKAAPGKTATDLWGELCNAHFDVSKRQVERDLFDLEQLSFFGVRCNDKGKPFGWYWPREAREQALGATFSGATGNDPLLAETALQRYLAPADLSDHYDPSPFFGREWLFDHMTDKLARSGSSLLVLRGVTGIGKSAFLGRLLRRDAVRVLAHYTCPPFGKASPEAIVKEFTHAITFQLANLNTTVRRYLTSLLEAPERQLLTCSPQERFRQLVVQSLAHLPSQQTQAILVIDGLDACTTPEGRNLLLELLLEMQADLPAWLRLVIASRPVPALDIPWTQVSIIDIDPADPDHQADLRSFAEHRIASRIAENQRHKQIEKILAASQGSFLFLAAIANCEDAVLNKAGSLPNNLDEFYIRSFARLYPDTAVYQAQQAPLLALLVGKVGTLHESILCDILNLTQRNLVRLLSPLLGQWVLRTNNAYRLFHPSLAEWLADPHRSGAFAVEGDGAKTIADWLTQRLRQNHWTDLPPIDRQHALNLLPAVVSSGNAWNEPVTLLDLARRLHGAYRYPAATILIQRLLTLVERDPENTVLFIRALCQHAANQRVLGNLEEAVAAIQRARQFAEANGIVQPGIEITLCRQSGLTAYQQQDYAGAAACFIRGSEVARQAPERSDLAELLNNAGRMLSRLPERWTEAEQCLNESLSLRQNRLGIQHPATGATLNNLGFLCSQSGRMEDAEKYYLQAIAAKTSRGSQDDEAVSLTESNLGSLYLHLKKFDRAEQYLLHALATRENRYGEQSIPVEKILRKLEKVYREQNRIGEADEILQRLNLV